MLDTVKILVNTRFPKQACFPQQQLSTVNGTIRTCPFSDGLAVVNEAAPVNRFQYIDQSMITPNIYVLAAMTIVLLQFFASKTTKLLPFFQLPPWWGPALENCR